MDSRRNFGPDSLVRLENITAALPFRRSQCPNPKKSLKLALPGVETVFGSDVISNDVTKHPRQALLSSAVLDYAAALA